MPDRIVPLCFDAGSGLVYLGFVNGDAFSAITICPVQYDVPEDSTLVEVVLRSIAVNYGTTIVGSHLDANTTPIDTDTQTLDTTSGNVAFALDTAYSTNDRLSISFDGQFNGGDVLGYARLRPT